MLKKPSVCSALLSAAAMILLITDPKTAFAGASHSLELCMKTVIPSLMPFFIISVILTSSLSGKRIPVMKPLTRICGIPCGAEGLFLLGLVGGYPVGAQAVAQSYEAGSITESQAKRMLGFCSNCGPSFLFGITFALFSQGYVPWMLWAIHILSAVLTAMLLPGKEWETVPLSSGQTVGISDAITKAIRNMANVCAWILIARCTIAYLDKWVLYLIPDSCRIWIIGILELTNGCVSLSEIPQEAERFIMISGFLASGGLCVGMQTVSVTGKLGTGLYFPGKAVQFSLSTVISAAVAHCLYPDYAIPAGILFLPVLGILIIMIKKKIEVDFSQKLVYNSGRI